MPVWRVSPRRQAYEDIDSALDYLLEQATPSVAHRFIDAVESAFTHLAHFPESGSPRLAQELEIPDLRSWPLRGFPYLICYVARHETVDIWRVLHQQRDIPNWLSGLDSEGTTAPR